MHLTNVGVRYGNTPQTQPMNARQVENNAGGFVFPVDDVTRLERFLILGTTGGTYYQSEQKITEENALFLKRMIEDLGQLVVGIIVGISTSGRAPREEYCIYALAMCSGAPTWETRRAALTSLPLVCRTGSSLFRFLSYVEQFRKWGRALRGSVAKWFNAKSAEEKLAYQLIKYKDRYGWKTADALRLAHPFPGDTADPVKQGALYRWAVGKEVDEELLPTLVRLAGQAPKATGADRLTFAKQLPREALPTEWLRDKEVWTAMLEAGMPLTAMIRNLATMTAVGALTPGSDEAKRVVATLTNSELLQQARVHPAKILMALAIYRSGKGDKGKQTWIPVPEVVDALDQAFYLAFPNVAPAGKRTLIGLDISGSMGSPLSSIPTLTHREATAALAMIWVATEPQVDVYGFTCAGNGFGAQWGGGDPGFESIPMRPGQKLADVVSYVQRMKMGGTDCSLPMRFALEQQKKVDTFIVLTDSETWAGSMHPMEALRLYRQQMGIPAKLVVIATSATPFSIADPNDAGSMDAVGFDASLPVIVNDFSRGEPAKTTRGGEEEEAA